MNKTRNNKKTSFLDLLHVGCVHFMLVAVDTACDWSREEGKAQNSTVRNVNALAVPAAL